MESLEQTDYMNDLNEINAAGLNAGVGFDLGNWHLSGLLDRTAAHCGDRPFLLGARTVSYRQARLESLQIAQALKARGVKRGDRVIISTMNRAEAILTLFAVARLGAIFVIINNLMKPHGFKQILNQTTPVAVLLDETTENLSGEVTNALLIMTGSAPSVAGRISFSELLTTEHPAEIPFPGIDLDPVSLVFTSGSTGSPRGVILSHDNIRFAAAAIQERLNYRSDDTIGVFLPLSFDYGLYQVFLGLQVGAAVFVGRPEMIGPEIQKILATEKISILPGVPTLFAALLKLQKRKPQAFPQLRCVTNTGDRLPQAYVDQLLGFFPDLRVFLMFGLTECKRVSILLPEEMKDKPGSVGRPLIGTEVYVIDAEGRRLPPGEIGELVVRGRNVTLGYWQAEEETRQRFRRVGSGQTLELFSGDSCEVDADGFIYFYGRNDHLLKHRGFRMSPLEVEEAACGIPNVSEAGLVKSDRDDLLHLFVSVTSAELTEEKIMNELLTRLEPVKIPDRIYIVPDLPKTANRKIDRKALKQQLPSA